MHNIVQQYKVKCIKKDIFIIDKVHCTLYIVHFTNKQDERNNCF